MNHHKPVSDDTLHLLVFLLDLMARNAGYTVRGAAGWATAKQIQARTHVWATHELMRAQARLGRVLEHDARVPGQAKSRWLYRITQKGADAIARALGSPVVTVEAPPRQEESRVLLDDAPRQGIEALRSALDAPMQQAREWIPGEAGWRSSLELTAEMDLAIASADGTGRWFTGEDVRWLARVGLVESRVLVHTHVYRLLPAGAALQLLEWREPDAA